MLNNVLFDQELTAEGIDLNVIATNRNVEFLGTFQTDSEVSEAIQNFCTANDVLIATVVDPDGETSTHNARPLDVELSLSFIDRRVIKNRDFFLDETLSAFAWELQYRGWINRPSHTQVEWTETGIAALRDLENKANEELRRDLALIGGWLEMTEPRFLCQSWQMREEAHAAYDERRAQ